MSDILLPAGILSPHSTTHEEEVEAQRLAEAEVVAGKVNKAPTGPTAPTGGWTCVMADGFGATLGTAGGQDNFWYPNRFSDKPANVNQEGPNLDELAVFNSSQVKVGANGLELDCTRSAGVGESHGLTRNYVGGYLQAVNPALAPAGYSFFQFLLGAGSTFAFEFVCKFPLNTGEMNNAMWALANPWREEFDFWEAWGWNSQQEGKTFLKYNGGCTWLGKGEEGNISQAEQDIGLKYEPSTAFHRYTVVVFPNNTFSMYVDGLLQKSVGSFPSGGVVSAPSSINSAYQGLILQNTLRKYENQFTSGTRTFFVRSAAVYQDTPHVGQHTKAGGLAPGTALV